METTVIDWIVWCIIGMAGGYMTARLTLGGRQTAFCVMAGMAGAVAAGYALMALWPGGDTALVADSQKVQLLSLLSALVGCAIVLWLVWLWLRRRGPADGDDGDDGPAA